VNHVRVVHFSTTATCCVDFEILSKGTENQIDIELEENGIPCDCICAYDFVIQLKSILNSKAKLSVKNMELKKDVPKLRPLEKRYFVFENDTIGFDDENGIRQGYIVYMRENDLKKIYYHDGKFIKLEIVNKEGKVIRPEIDEDKILDY
jgi:hypothetical protein